MAKFFAGNVVKLKSGGPDMTVVGYFKIQTNSQQRVVRQFSTPRFAEPQYQETTRVDCVWFDGIEKKVGRFEEDVLILKQDSSNA
jgi:uncharacterized protein YodC (DUF2158 family)